MGVTNFTSIVSAQSQGVGDVNKMVTAFDSLSSAIDRANSKSKDLSSHPGFDSFAAKVKSGISDPLGTLGDIAETALKRLGPLGGGIASAGAIFTTFATSGYAAAASLGHFADSIGDTSVRLGLSIKQTGDFSFAMSRAGGSIESLEGVMRKLNQGLTDTSEEGVRARKGMVDLGITAFDAATGKMRPMSDILVQLADRLADVGSTAKGKADAIAVLGKSALAVLPDLMELTDGLRRAKDLGLSPSDADIAKWDMFQKQTAEIDAQLDRITRKLKEPLASVWSVTVRGIFGDTSDIGDAGFKALKSQIGKIAPGEAQRRLDSGGGFFSASATAELQQLINDKIASEIGGTFSSGLTVSNSIFTNRIGAALGSPTDEGRLTDAKAKLKELQDVLRADTQLHKPITDSDLRAVELQQQAVLAIEKQIKFTKELEEAKKHNLELDKQSSTIFSKAFFGDASTPAAARNATLAQIEASRKEDLAKFPLGAAGINADYDKQKYAAWITYIDASAKNLREFNDEVRTAAQESPAVLATMFKNHNEAIDSRLRTQGTTDATGGLNPSFFGASQTFSAPLGYRSPEQQLRDVQDNARRSQGLFTSRAALNGLSEGDTISGELVLRQQSAAKIYDAEKVIADLRATAAERYIANLDVEDRRDQALFDAKLERDQKLLDLAVRAKDAFSNTAVGLFEAAKSGGVAGFLKGELNKLEDTIVGNAAKLAFGDPTKKTGLSGLIPHASDGIFGKLLGGTPFGPDALKDATTLNTIATQENSAAIRAMQLSRSGGGGSAGGFGLPGFGGRIFGGGGGIFTNSGLPGDTGYTSDGVPRYSPESYGPDGSYLGPGATGGPDPSAVGASARGSAGGFTLGKGVGIAGAGVAGAFGIYSGLKAGGAQGGLEAGASAAAAAGTIASIASASSALGPIGIAVGAGLGLVANLLGDPKKARADQLAGYARDRYSAAPTGTSYSQDLYGRGVDTDYLGHSRSFTTITYNINALDSRSFQDYLIANPGSLAAGVANAAVSGNGDDMLVAIRQS